MMRSTGSRLIARPGTFMARPRRRLPWWTGMAVQIVGFAIACGVALAIGGARG